MSNSTDNDESELRLLMTSLSHELCRPLASLRAGFDLLMFDQASVASSSQQNHLRSMVSMCDSMLGLTRGYLDYAKLVADEPSFGRYSLGAIIREVGGQFHDQACDKGILLKIIDETDHGRVTTDVTLCQHILSHLVSNAVKYAGNGGRVSLKAAIGASEWSVTVADDGLGIPPEAHQQVFDPFFRLARDEHSQIEGNGLGLTICRELTHRLSGSIHLESQENRGTTIEVRFPLAGPPEAS